MAHSEIRLSVAEERTIYDVAAIDRAMEEAAGNRNEALATLYDKMKQRGGGRFLIRPTGADMIDDLYDTCPNFSFTPILLLGEPGIGKTHFARELANRLGTGHEFISMSSLTAGWVLSGASAQWNNAKPGKVAHTLVHGDYANPIVVLDEIDKAGGDSRYDPMGSLYGLLEHDTARAFKDEFIDIDIDASHILWVTTANDERSIPEPILNRMNVGQHDWGFPPEADEAVLERLGSLPPRDMRKRLLAAFGTAKLEGRNWLEGKDFEQARMGRSRKIGF